ncbi:MAG: O-antigen ligase family protein [Pseudomonadota bacterium]|nr:O-antigen ligase family protein [Pseudomonadota bacterium]
MLIGAGLYGKDITGRFAHLSDDMAMRANIYATTERAIADAPLLGTGLGTFAPVFRMYRGEDIETRIVNAHNTYLENALELGIPAAAMLTLAVLLVVLICLKGVGARRRNRILPAIGVAASVHVGLHALVDFGLETPAVTWAYAFILGLAAGQSFSSKANRQKC